MGGGHRVYDHRNSAQHSAAVRSAADLARAVAVSADHACYSDAVSLFEMETGFFRCRQHKIATFDRRGYRHSLRHTAVFLGGEYPEKHFDVITAAYRNNQRVRLHRCNVCHSHNHNLFFYPQV